MNAWTRTAAIAIAVSTGCSSQSRQQGGSAAPAPVEITPFRFVQTSDTHIAADAGPGSHAETDAALWSEMSALTPPPAFTVNTGDTVEAGKDDEYATYRKTIAAHLTCPHYDAPGNHDIRWNPLGKEGFTLGTGQPLYQSWDHNGIHFVTLDSCVLLQHWGHFDQKMLDWLKADLEKVGPARPVIIGFHHWIGRETVQVDNEQQLMKLVEPYNVRLWLQGHGHADIDWSVNGVPATMQGGLYQGSYMVVDVTPDSLKLTKRTWGKGKKELIQDNVTVNKQPVKWTEMFTIPLAKPTPPNWSAVATHTGDHALLSINPGDLPQGTKFTYRFDQAKPTPLPFDAKSPTTRPSIATLNAGTHIITVQAELPDHRAYQKPLELHLTRPTTPNPTWKSNIGGAVLSHLVLADSSPLSPQSSVLSPSENPQSAIRNPQLILSSMSGSLLSLNPATGHENWRFPTQDSLFSTPEVTADTAYFGSADHHVYAVNLATGKQRWKFQTKAAVLGGPALAQNIVAIASTDRTIYGLDASTGQPKWTVKVDGMYQSKAATDGHNVYLAGWDNTIRAIDAATGHESWTVQVGRTNKGLIAFPYSPAISSPALGDGKLFITSNDGVLHALSTADGRELWSTDQHNLGYSSPLYHDNTVYCAISNGGNVFAADAQTGKLLWQNKTGSDIYDSSFTFSAGQVFIGSVDGTFSSLDAKTGQIRWQYNLGPGHLLASPASDDSQVFIANMAGNVFAFPTTR